MKLLRALLVTVLAVALAATTAYGVGVVVRDDADRAPTHLAPTVEAETPAAQPHGASAEPVRPGPVLEPGDRGEQVRELQARLFQLDWLPEQTTGRYDAATSEAVRGFQDERGLRPPAWSTSAPGSGCCR